MIWKGGSEVDCVGLENRSGCKPTLGWNPTPSANGEVAERLKATVC